MTRRQDRVNVLLRQEISRLLSYQVKDPRLSSVISITRVKVSGDLRYAKVYVSVLGDDKAKGQCLKALESASGFLHKELRQTLSLRNVPHFRFLLDDSIEQGAYVLEVIRRTASNSGS